MGPERDDAPARLPPGWLLEVLAGAAAPRPAALCRPGSAAVYTPAAARRRDGAAPAWSASSRGVHTPAAAAAGAGCSPRLIRCPQRLCTQPPTTRCGRTARQGQPRASDASGSERHERTQNSSFSRSACLARPCTLPGSRPSAQSVHPGPSTTRRRVCSPRSSSFASSPFTTREALCLTDGRERHERTPPRKAPAPSRSPGPEPIHDQ